MLFSPWQFPSSCLPDLPLCMCLHLWVRHTFVSGHSFSRYLNTSNVRVPSTSLLHCLPPFLLISSISSLKTAARRNVNEHIFLLFLDTAEKLNNLSATTQTYFATSSKAWLSVCWKAEISSMFPSNAAMSPALSLQEPHRQSPSKRSCSQEHPIFICRSPSKKTQTFLFPQHQTERKIHDLWATDHSLLEKTSAAKDYLNWILII